MLLDPRGTKLQKVLAHDVFQGQGHLKGYYLDSQDLEISVQVDFVSRVSHTRERERPVEQFPEWQLCREDFFTSQQAQGRGMPPLLARCSIRSSL